MFKKVIVPEDWELEQFDPFGRACNSSLSIK